jgi:hypothetical protein
MFSTILFYFLVSKIILLLSIVLQLQQVQCYILICYTYLVLAKSLFDDLVRELVHEWE